ncbi:GNAT family N-acetyltransferase [Alteromonas sp. S167]|uniref:GNAT family N-acetyltransferase n=1 Tax=Alteromonas sp. S167 TaxID=3117402 RepID=UPI002FE035C9
MKGTLSFSTPRFNNTLLDSNHAFETAALYQDSKVMRLIGDPLSEVQSRAVVTQFLKNNQKPWPVQKVWAITSVDSNTFCGIQMLRKEAGRNEAEIGIILRREANGRGVAVEAMGALAHFGLGTLGLTAITATFDKKHLATKRLVTTLGFEESTFVEPKEADRRFFYYHLKDH